MSVDPSFSSHNFRLTVTQYDRIIEAGIIDEENRVELIKGFLVVKLERSRAHIQVGNTGMHALYGLAGEGWHVAKGDPVVVSDWSKPDPDLTLVRGEVEDYTERDVAAPDLGLVVEIADSSLCIDRQVKKPIYAASKIPVYWIINLVDHQVEVYSDPEGREYRTSQVFTREEDVPLVLDGVEVGRIRVADLLP